MTTAPMENRGGIRLDAPQNNPANVSGTGGAGQSGEFTGFAYGENQALNNSMSEGNAAVASVNASAAPTASMPPLQTLTDNIGGVAGPITAGIDFGPGAGSDAMPKGISANTRPDENKKIIVDYLPDLIQAASYAGAPDSFKRFVNYLASK